MREGVTPSRLIRFSYCFISVGVREQIGEDDASGE